MKILSKLSKRGDTKEQDENRFEDETTEPISALGREFWKFLKARNFMNKLLHGSASEKILLLKLPENKRKQKC